MKKLLDKIILSEKEYEYLTKGIAIGVGLGIVIGTILDEIVLFFALGGVIGIISALIFSFIKRNSRDNKLSFNVKPVRHRKKGLLFTTIVIACAILIFSMTSTLPRVIGKIASCSYVDENYSELNLNYVKMQFSLDERRYLAIFEDEQGEIYSFLMSPRLFPTAVINDPLDT